MWVAWVGSEDGLAGVTTKFRHSRAGGNLNLGSGDPRLRGDDGEVHGGSTYTGMAARFGGYPLTQG